MLQHLRGVLADGLQHREARFVGRLVETDEALVEELADELDDVAADLVRRPAHRLGHLQVEAAAEHRQPVDEPPCPVVQQVVAPGDRAAQRLLALRDVAGSDRQQLEVMLEPSQDLIRRQELDPRRGELDGKRHPVQARRDPGHRGRIGVRDGEGRSDGRRPRDEQPDRLELGQCLEIELAQGARQVQALDLGQAAGVGRRRQARHRVLLLTRDPERDARRDEASHVRAAPQQVGDIRSRRRHLLEVVEDEQDPPIADLGGQPVDCALRLVVGEAEGPRDRRRHQRRVAHRVEGHEPDPVGEVIRR